MNDLYAIGTDRPSGELSWKTIDVQGSVSGLADLGSNPLKGLAYNPTTRLFYTISPAGPGGPHLCSLSPTGSLQSLGPVGPNLTGGLAYHAPDDSFYAIANDPAGGLAMLHRLTLGGQDVPLFAIAQGSVHGLTYVAATNRFYALITHDNFTWFYTFDLSGSVVRLFGAGLRVFGGLCHSLSENLFYFAANEVDGFSRLWTLELNGAVVNRMGLGYDFNHAAISTAPWFGGTINVKSPLENERFLVSEPARLDANIVDATGRYAWDSGGLAWESDRDGFLGTGTVTKNLSLGTHVITASLERLKRTVTVRVFADLWALYQAAPAPAEIERVQRDFNILWVDGTAGDPTQQWATYPDYPFDQTSPNPSRTAVIAKLDVLRHQRFAEPLPFGTSGNVYDHVRQYSPTLRVSLGSALNEAGGGVINLNRGFTLWSNNPAQPTIATPYVGSLYLLLHENRHNEPGEPGHTSCPTSWNGLPGITNGMDAQFEPGSGYARAALYLMWVYKYALYDPASIRTQAKSDAVSLASRFCTRPASANPAVQALLVELWSV